MRKYLNNLNKDFFVGKSIPGMDKYVITEYKDQGDNAFIFKAEAKELNHEYACKIIPKGNQSSNWMDEVEKANKLDHPSVVKCHYSTEWLDKENEIECLVLVLDYVNGISLTKYLKSNKGEITVNFVEEFLKIIFDLLHEMKGRGIDHGDLHSGNILVESSKKYSLTPITSFRVTDFAIKSAVFSLGSEDDYLELSKILYELLLTIDYQNLESRERFAFNFIKDNFLARHLIEKDRTRDHLAQNPKGLFKLLNSIDEEYSKISSYKAKAILITPFDYLSCEQMGGSSSILHILFSNQFIGFNDIEVRNNLILTGPRGCGKSTIFKSLSLKHRYLSEDAEPETIRYIGIYYRCDDLYFAFPRFKEPQNPSGIDVPIHYLISTLLSSVLETIEIWANKYFPSDFQKHQQNLCKELWEILNIKKPNGPDADTFRCLLSSLKKERTRAKKKRDFLNDSNQQFKDFFGPDVLIKSCDLILNKFPFLEGKPFYFFIDDYSTPKITIDLQKNLNRLLMLRNSFAFFKISTESSISYVNEDIDGKAYVEGREFTLINLGLNFITGDSNSNLAFIEDILSRRLKAVPDFPATTIDELIGDNKHDENNSALLIRNGKPVEYSGKTILCKLCSGDIFYVIKLVGAMVTAAGGKDALATVDSLPKIKPSQQNSAIRKEAGNFLRNLRELPNGEHLIEIVSAFCAVAKSYIKFKDSKNEDETPPHQASRIELYEEPKLSKEASDYYNELLRYSVFFEDIRGKSRRGKFVPRLLLRRFLIPQFLLTFSKRDNIGMEPSELETLLLSPNDFERDKILKKPQGSSDVPNQMGLYDGSS